MKQLILLILLLACSGLTHAELAENYRPMQIQIKRKAPSLFKILTSSGYDCSYEREQFQKKNEISTLCTNSNGPEERVRTCSKVRKEEANARESLIICQQASVSLRDECLEYIEKGKFFCAHEKEDFLKAEKDLAICRKQQSSAKECEQTRQWKQALEEEMRDCQSSFLIMCIKQNS